jgi:hypothetical protein
MVGAGRYRGVSMLRRFRERTARLAAALVVLLAMVGAPHSVDPGHDGDHGVVLVAHDESAHRVRAAASDTDSRPLHCLVCHLTRSFRPRTEARGVSAPAARIAVRVHTDIFTASCAALIAQPPLRSPPVSPVSV